MTMLTIWGRANSINVMKVLWICTELGLAYERRDAGLQYGVVDTPEYGAMNPNRRVPTLSDGDFVLWESNTIVRYLAARERRFDLLPETARGRADVERWMDWATSTLAIPMTPVFWQLIRTPAERRDHAVLDRSRSDAARCFAILEAQLAGRAYICGDLLTAADIAVAPFVHRWFALPVEHGETPTLRGYYQRLLGRPGFLAHCAQPLS
jgi:glutathione S-transferase